jgi:hypothetical protein
MDYSEFLQRKSQVGCDAGFDPVFMPSMLFPFQVALVEWATRKGRAAIFSDCGTGKSFMQLAWAENVARHTDGRILILTPLAVAFQTVGEGVKLGVDVTHRRDRLHPGDRIVVTNYERLHHFDCNDFAGVVCDESSILKNFDGETRKAITDFMRKRPYRLLCTATAAPNDYIELGTSSEALGDLRRVDMMSQFFSHDGGDTQRWALKGHGERPFWRWVCSWARAMRKPSDLGFSDDGFALPPLTVRNHTVKSAAPLEGYLFDLPAVGLQEQRQDLRRTIGERCGMAAQLVNAHARAAVVWCNLNDEGKELARSISGAVEVCGADPEEFKEETFAAFVAGKVRVLVTKASIAGFGLNLQHCAHQTFFPSHSYEQYYQAVRRCWRFGQKSPVTVDMITTDGQADVLQNLNRKAEQASRMFDHLVALMWQELKVVQTTGYNKKEELPQWL